jgi:hypothetical protein
MGMILYDAIRSNTMRIIQDLDGLPLPFEPEWTIGKIRAALCAYIWMVLEKSSKRAETYVLRWTMAFEHSERRESADGGFDFGWMNETIRLKFKEYAERVQDKSRGITEVEELFELHLLDYCDDILLTMLSPEQAVDFVRDFAKYIPS